MRAAAALGAALWLVILGVVFSFNNAQAGNVATGSIARITGGTINGATIGATNPKQGTYTRASITQQLIVGSAITAILPNIGLSVAATTLTGSGQYSITSGTTFSASAITNGNGYLASDGLAQAAFTMNNYRGFWAVDLLKGAGSALNNQYGFYIADLNSGGTSNTGFYSAMTSGAGKWSFYSAGTANNAFAGNTRFGSVVEPTVALDVTGAIQASTTLKTGGYTVATLPTCNAGAAGTMAYVTNALAPAWNAALAGGGAVTIGAFCNGAAWVAH